MKRISFALIALSIISLDLSAQKVDTLQATIFTSKAGSNYISKGKDLRTEVISSHGLMKMACCNLAESFENSASVTVGYSDATTGARQIRLLGLSGAYTQMLDENRPVMRGLASPFGLTYVPGSWLESIQIAKGSPSVINGVESMTGQINLEYKKPTDEKPLFVNGSVMTDTKTDLNILTSQQLNDKFYTIVMGHVDGNFKTHDMNGDSFADEPLSHQLNLANRWLYYTPEWTIHWGASAVRDTRKGGQIYGSWKSDVANTALNGYLKAGHALKEDNAASVAVIADYTFQKMDSGFGTNIYDATQHSWFANLIYRNAFNDSHDLTVGVNASVDNWIEDIHVGPLLAYGTSILEMPGHYTDSHKTYAKWSPYAEYTFKSGETFSMIAGFAGLFMGKDGFFPSPRLTFKYQPFEALVLRANGGRGVRRANPVTDNLGILSTGKSVYGDLTERQLEDSWTYGGNATLHFSEHTYLSLDFFRTSFSKQQLLYREGPYYILFYSLDGNTSRSNNYQADFSTEPTENLSFTLTARYTDAAAWQPMFWDDEYHIPNVSSHLSGKVREVALTSRFKGVFNAQYKTRLSKWIFDFTASVTGPSRVYDFMLDLKGPDGKLLYPDGMTSAFPLLYAQVTRRFKGFDIYVGGENLTGYMQPSPVIDASNPFSTTFDAASIWGPLMGRKIYAGFRITVWK